jgi:hypothetical protein
MENQKTILGGTMLHVRVGAKDDRRARASNCHVYLSHAGSSKKPALQRLHIEFTVFLR